MQFEFRDGSHISSGALYEKLAEVLRQAGVTIPPMVKGAKSASGT
jgi:hypothetical protein